MADYVVIVTGSRNWHDPDAVRAMLDAVLAAHEPLVVRHGACPSGPDRFAAGWARERHQEGRQVREDPRPADWNRHGRRAGFIRNEEMVADGADECLAFLAPCVKPGCRLPAPHSSHGAMHCAGLAQEAGIPLMRHYQEER